MRGTSICLLLFGTQVLNTGAIRIPDNTVNLQHKGQRKLTSVQQKVLSGGSKYRPLDLSALKDHNLVIIGDSVDRSSMDVLCKIMKGKFSQLDALRADQGLAGMKYGYQKLLKRDQALAEKCDLPEQNTSVMYLFHPGVTSMAPEPWWHIEPLMKNTTSLHRNRSTSRMEQLPVTETTQQVVTSAEDLAKIWFKPAVEDLLKDQTRPIIVMANSHLWDFARAREYLSDHDLPFSTEQSGLEMFGWKNIKGIQAFDWEDRATRFIQAIKDSGIPYERFLWRTNSNCPVQTNMAKDEVPFLTELMDEAAEVARKNVKEQQGPWKGVELMDFRKDFDASVMDVTSDSVGHGHCEKGVTLHYSTIGYRAYWESLFHALGGTN